MISLRASGSDNNPLGASAFCSIPVPIGTQDGNLVLVGIGVPSANITITPPDEGWTLLFRTDPSRTLGLAVYWKIALSEQARWVFALSAAAQAMGAVLVYSGADLVEPIEASAAALSVSGTAHTVPAITVADDGEEVVLFLAAGAAGTYTPGTGYLRAASKAQTAAQLEAHRKQQTTAAALATFNATFSASTLGASVVLVLRASVGTVSIDEARALILGGLPRGVERVYDLEPGGDYYNFFQSIAATIKAYGLDAIDALWRETVIRTARLVIPVWERIFGLETSIVALNGTLPQRRAQIIAAWRAAAGQGCSEPEVQAVLAAALGYNAGTLPEIIRCDRSTLRLLHSYGGTLDLVLPSMTTTTTYATIVSDGGKVSSAGARLTLLFETLPVAYSITLTAPDGVTTKTWSRGWGYGPIELYGKEFAGASISGKWKLAINNATGFSNKLMSQSSLFVEAIGEGEDNANQATAGAAVHWGVYADPVHVGENGTPADLDSALELLQRMARSHTVVAIVTSREPRPGIASGGTSSIPDRCIPV